ncbi:DNA-directed RNA polymerase subunit omega [candidate division KSB1 bacterium]
MSTTLDIKKIMNNCDNIYKAVIVSARRARQIHNKMNDELRKQLGEVENEEDLEEENIDREEIVKSFDKIPKPSVTAIGEFIDGKLSIVNEDTEENPDR